MVTDRLIRTFLDSGVLITGYRGTPERQEAVLFIARGSKSTIPQHLICLTRDLSGKHSSINVIRNIASTGDTSGRAAMFNDVILDRANRESARSGVSGNETRFTS